MNIKKPSANAVDDISNWEHAKYDPTHKLKELYTIDTPQYNQCGLIAQPIQHNVQTQHAIVGRKYVEM